jgi:hypothetical protein
MALALACTNEPTAAPPGPTLSPEPEAPLRVVSTEPAEGVAAVTWREARRVGPETLDVLYVGGKPECDLLVNVRIAESSENVTLTLFTGRRAGDRAACAPVGQTVRTRVTLRAPLGDRPVLDGAVSPPERREVRG